MFVVSVAILTSYGLDGLCADKQTVQHAAGCLARCELTDRPPKAIPDPQWGIQPRGQDIRPKSRRRAQRMGYDRYERRSNNEVVLPHLQHVR